MPIVAELHQTNGLRCTSLLLGFSEVQKPGFKIKAVTFCFVVYDRVMQAQTSQKLFLLSQQDVVHGLH